MFIPIYKTMRYILLDTETTGKDLEKSRVIQLAYKVYEGGKPKEFNGMFKPPIPIEIGAMAVHHTTNEDVEGKPEFSTILPELEELFDDETVAIAHNASFDIKMMNNEGVYIPRHVCTYKVAYKLLPEQDANEGHSLQILRYALDLYKKEPKNLQAHDAMGDVIVLDHLFDYLCKRVMNAMNCDTFAAIEVMEKISAQPILYRSWRFGKHKGQPIAGTDRGYMQWVLDNFSKKENPDENLLYTMRHYLFK